MNRRGFLGGTGVAMMIGSQPLAAYQMRFRKLAMEVDVFVEREQDGKPHAGKVLAAVVPHSDDISLFGAGTVLKLIEEGYTAYLIRTTNDEAKGLGATPAEVILNNEKDNREVGKRLGVKKVIDLGYRSRYWNDTAYVEMRARLVYLFRLLKVDTVICDDPFAHYEENPDHFETARCAAESCLLAGDQLTFPEHFDAGLQPQAVNERYYYARGPQLVNRVVEISSFMDRKVEVNIANRSLGPAGESGSKLRAQLAAEGRKLPLLGDNDDSANRQYIKHLVLAEDAEAGKSHGLDYAEPFHYIGPKNMSVDDYVEKNAV
jgi:LmbE family N-acetylglucosaminyl deacetylase